MLANPITLWCTATLCATVSTLRQACLVPLDWMLIRWIKSFYPLPFPLLHYQFLLLLYSLLPPTLFRSFSQSLQGFLPFFNYHLHQNLIFCLVSGKPLEYLCTGVSRWWWIVSLLVAAKSVVGSSCTPCKST